VAYTTLFRSQAFRARAAATRQHPRRARRARRARRDPARARFVRLAQDGARAVTELNPAEMKARLKALGLPKLPSEGGQRAQRCPRQAAPHPQAPFTGEVHRHEPRSSPVNFTKFPRTYAIINRKRAAFAPRPPGWTATSPAPSQRRSDSGRRLARVEHPHDAERVADDAEQSAPRRIEERFDDVARGRELVEAAARLVGVVPVQGHTHGAKARRRPLSRTIAHEEQGISGAQGRVHDVMAPRFRTASVHVTEALQRFDGRPERLAIERD